MSSLRYVTYCGLYCRLCANMSRIPGQASALRDTLARSGYEHFGESVVSGFREFWSTLEFFSKMDKSCPDCRHGCGDPGCIIRECARERGIRLCSSCGDFPCGHIQELAERYPNLIPDATRQREIGLNAWIAEQEERVEEGFCYLDVYRG